MIIQNRIKEILFLGTGLVCAIPNGIFLLNILGLVKLEIPLFILIPSFTIFTITAFFSIQILSKEDMQSQNKDSGKI